MLTYLGIGLVLGVVTGIPVGLVNVAVIETARRNGLRFAIGVAAGGALSDTVHAWLAIAGLGPYLDRNALVPPIMYMVSGLAIGGYGLVVLRSRGVTGGDVEPKGEARGAGSGLMLGLMLTLPNIAALLAWVFVAGVLFVGVSLFEGTCVAIGVGVGSFMWFATLASLGRHGTASVSDRWSRWIGRAVGGVLMAFGIASFSRGVHYMIVGS